MIYHRYIQRRNYDKDNEWNMNSNYCFFVFVLYKFSADPRQPRTSRIYLFSWTFILWLFFFLFSFFLEAPANWICPAEPIFRLPITCTLAVARGDISVVGLIESCEKKNAQSPATNICYFIHTTCQRIKIARRHCYQPCNLD